MNQAPSDTNRETLPAGSPEESGQSAAIESTAIETGISGTLPKMPRIDTTPTLKVNSSS